MNQKKNLNLKLLKEMRMVLILYAYRFQSYAVKIWTIVKPNPTLGLAIFSTDYPPVPDAQKLQENPNLPVHDKEYSTEDNSTTDESIDFSDDEENNSDNSEQSYV